jgi:hypothetical protein
MTDDAELLRQYAQSGSDTAFADLVGRYLAPVYAAASGSGRHCPRSVKGVGSLAVDGVARKHVTSLYERICSRDLARRIYKRVVR